VKLVESAKITGAIAKKVFATMFESGRTAADTSPPKASGAQVTDTAIEEAAREVIAKNPDKRRQVQIRQRRRLQIFRRPGHESHSRPS